MANDQLPTSPPSVITSAMLNKVMIGATAPINSGFNTFVAGDLWNDTSTSPPTLKQWNGSAWASVIVPVAPGGTVLQWLPGIPTGATNFMCVAWSPNGQYLAVGFNASPYLAVYTYDTSLGLFSKVSTLGVALAGAPNMVAWSPDGAYVGAVHATTPFVTVVACTAGTLGTKVADPGAVPAGTGQSIAWNPAGTAIAVGHSTTPFVDMWAWSAGFGTKAAALSGGNLPDAAVVDLAWSPTGLALAGAQGATTALAAWRVTAPATWGTRFSAPASPLNVAGTCVTINAAGNVVFCGTNDNTNNFGAWLWTDTAFSGRLTNPSLSTGATTTSCGNARFWEQGSTAYIVAQGVLSNGVTNQVLIGYSAGAFTGIIPFEIAGARLIGSNSAGQLSVNPITKALAIGTAVSPFAVITLPRISN